MLACMVVWYGDSQRSMFDVGDISAGLALPSMLSGFGADAASRGGEEEACFSSFYRRESLPLIQYSASLAAL